ncbi:MAG: acyltransferase [Candidatus Freyarchaeota archaeon]|nr:hypothetical protein [Candidatus Freyrarchaeum guaymaensis]
MNGKGADRQNAKILTQEELKQEARALRRANTWFAVRHNLFLIAPAILTFLTVTSIIFVAFKVLQWVLDTFYVNYPVLWPILGYPTLTLGGLTITLTPATAALILAAIPIVHVIAKFIYFLYLLVFAKILVKPIPEGRYPYTPANPVVRQFILNATITGTFLNFFGEGPWGRAELSRLMYKALGAKVGKNVFPATILDPYLAEVGDGTVMGAYSCIAGHAIEGDTILFAKAKVGRKCVLGFRSLVWPGAELGDNVIIGTYSMVPKGAKLPSNSVWAGIPVKLVKKFDEEEKGSEG